MPVVVLRPRDKLQFSKRLFLPILLPQLTAAPVTEPPHIVWLKWQKLNILTVWSLEFQVQGVEKCSSSSSRSVAFSKLPSSLTGPFLGARYPQRHSVTLFARTAAGLDQHSSQCSHLSSLASLQVPNLQFSYSLESWISDLSICILWCTVQFLTSLLFKITHYLVGDLAQWVKIQVAELDDQSSIPVTHICKERTNPHQLSS